MENTVLTIAVGATLVLSAYSAVQLSSTSYRIARTKQQKIFIDTSVLIDGRIVEVAKHGFIPGTLCISKAVLGELQFMADNADAEKRQRARHGLDVVRTLQEISNIQVEILRENLPARVDVDAHLRYLSKKYNGILCTIDYNLIKVAEVESIRILNVNDLALALRGTYLPGEKATIELTTKGNDTKQAVGHLDDGTMVVVEDSYRDIGSSVEVEFIRSIQTSAGRMLFAKRTGAGRTTQQSKTNKPTGKKLQSHLKTSAVEKTVKPRVGDQKTLRQKRHYRTRESNEDNLLRLVNGQDTDDI